MEDSLKRALVTRTGKELLALGLVARTWGNVSCRLDDTSFLITPSGLDYTETREEDLAICHMDSKEWEGPHKPSSERKVHKAAYLRFDDCNFVIHTHQIYASAIGLTGIEDLDITEEEKALLGGIALAGYALSGTKKLEKQVKKAMAGGAHTILMPHHGALIAGESCEDTLQKARLLESICKRNFKGASYIKCKRSSARENLAKEALLAEIREEYPYASFSDTPAIRTWSLGHRPLFAQLDDMAQMIGSRIDFVSPDREQILKALKKKNALLIRPYGALVCGRDEGDTQALRLLTEKAAVAALHSYACRKGCRLGKADCLLQYMVYQKKYSKLKQGDKT